MSSAFGYLRQTSEPSIQWRARLPVTFRVREAEGGFYRIQIRLGSGHLIDQSVKVIEGVMEVTVSEDAVTMGRGQFE
jgi:hypothetical protein